MPDTPRAGSALALGTAAQEAAAYNAARGMARADIENRIQRLDDQVGDLIGKVFDGGRLDLPEYERAGSGAQEKIIAINSALGGYTRRIGELDREAAEAARAEAAKEAALANLMPQGRTPVAAGARVPDRVREFFASLPEGTTLGQIAREGRTHRIDTALGPDLHSDPRAIRAATFTTGSYDPWQPRERDVTLDAQRPPEVLDVIPMASTMSDTVRWMEETTFTNAAAGRAEAADSAEATIAFTERTQAVEHIAVNIPLTEEILDDEPMIRSIVGDRLPFMLRQKTDEYLISGSGSSNQLRGILNWSGIGNSALTETSNVITKPIQDLREAQSATYRSAYVRPDTVICSSQFCDDIVLAETSAAGFYLGSAQGGFMPMPWGLRVVESTVLTYAASAKTAILGNMNPAWIQLFVRNGFMVESGLSGSDFIAFRVRLRGSFRGALVLHRPECFHTLTRAA